MKSNLSQDLDIDIKNLEVDWLCQAKLYRHYSDQLADARKDLDQAEDFLKFTEAEKYLRYRKKMEKASEGMIRSRVACNSEVREAIAKINECKHTVNLLSGAVTSFEHRKRALENLVELQGRQYFAAPKEPHSLNSIDFSARAKMSSRESAVARLKERRNKE